MSETRWCVSPFLMGGWCTRGIGRESALLLTGGEELKLCEAEEEEKEEVREAEGEGSSWLLLATMVMVLEAEQPMISHSTMGVCFFSQKMTLSFFFFLPNAFSLQSVKVKNFVK